MEGIKVNDMLNWANDKDILSILKGEKLYYCDAITKVNHYGMSQERCIILSDKSLYNMKKRTFRRKITYNLIRGITYSKLTYEFVVHGNDDEYDYEYISPDRNLIICLIAIFYQKINSKPLNICEVQEKSLKNYVTGKKEKKKDHSFSRMDTKFLIDTADFINKNIAEISDGNKKVSSGTSSNDKKKRTNTLFSKHKTSPLATKMYSRPVGYLHTNEKKRCLIRSRSS